MLSYRFPIKKTGLAVVSVRPVFCLLIIFKAARARSGKNGAGKTAQPLWSPRAATPIPMSTDPSRPRRSRRVNPVALRHPSQPTSVGYFSLCLPAGRAARRAVDAQRTTIHNGKFIGCVGGDVGDTERKPPGSYRARRIGCGGCCFCSIRRLAVKRRDPNRGSMRRGE
ncbi:MAG: hypothetical protein H6Q76_1473 [Firmicutes bacterium]|nr:hypothetical protein [Bacillota bacterium]